MSIGEAAQHRQARRAAGQQTLAAVGAAVFAVLLAIGGLLWAHFGEAVYLDRIFSTIANCI